MMTARRRLARPGLTRFCLVTAFSALAWTSAGAQNPAPPPATQPPGQPPATPPKPAPRRTAPATAAARTSTATVTVTDPGGQGLSKVTITITGPVPRTGQTAANGSVHIAGLKAGDYRFRFEHDGFYTLERDVAVKSGLPVEVDASLTEAPPPPAPPPPAAPVATMNTAPPGDPKSVLLVDYIEQNPVKEDQLGCTASAQTTLLQLKDPLPEQSRADADEVLYVVAGEGTLRLGGKDMPLKSSSLVVVPRGTTRAVTRKGRNPMYLLSIVSGTPCTK